MSSMRKHFFKLKYIIDLFCIKGFVAKTRCRKGRAYRLIYNVVKINSELKGKQGQQSFQDHKLIVTMLSLSKKKEERNRVGAGLLRSSYVKGQRGRSTDSCCCWVSQDYKGSKVPVNNPTDTIWFSPQEFCCHHPINLPLFFRFKQQMTRVGCLQMW